MYSISDSKENIENT